MNEEGITASQVVENAKAEDVEEVQMEDAAQRLIAETNAKLKEGKERALGMLKTVNNMKEELNLIDDEIMVQREKMVGIRDKMKKTQSMVYQTKKIARNLAQSLNSDIWIKVLLGLITLAILGAITMVVITKMQVTAQTANGTASVLDNFTQKDYDEIDEQFFHDLEVNPEAAAKKFGVQTGSNSESGPKAVDDGAEIVESKGEEQGMAWEKDKLPKSEKVEGAAEEGGQTDQAEEGEKEEERDEAGEEGKEKQEETAAEETEKSRRLAAELDFHLKKVPKRLQNE
jgi:hypothetical protein